MDFHRTKREAISITLDVSSSKAGYAAVSSSVVRAARKLQTASRATSRARNSKGDSKFHGMDQLDNEEMERVVFSYI